MSIDPVDERQPAGAPQFEMVGALLDRAQRTPARPWLHQPTPSGVRLFTWSDAAHQVRCIAAALRELRLPAGSRIAIAGRNTAHWVMADLAVMLAGHVPVGLFPGQSVENTTYVLQHSGAVAVFVGPADDIAETLDAIPSGVIKIALPYSGVPSMELAWDTLVQLHPPIEIGDRQTPTANEIALLLYTSGTSGRPKGVKLSHGNIAFTAQNALVHVFKPEGPQRLLSYLPLAHAQERLTGEALGLLVGAEIYFVETLDRLAPTLEQVAPTFFTGGPAVYERMRAAILARLSAARLNSLLGLPGLGRAVAYLIRRKLGLHRARLCIVGGAKASDELVRWFATLGIILRQGYGATENCGYVACNLDGADRSGSVGRPLPGAEVRISGEGEIQCRHDGTMLGYFGDPDATREALTEDGYFRTGDAGWLDCDGFLYIRGRLADTLMTPSGRRIHPAMIEAAFACALVAQMCLLTSATLMPVLIVTLRPAALAMARHEVESQLALALDLANQTLPDSERIDRVVVAKGLWTAASGLVTPTMKVRRQAVSQVYLPCVTYRRLLQRTVLWADDTPPVAAAG